MTTQESPHGSSASPPGPALARMINGYWLTQMIYTATRLGIADALAGGPQTAGRLAERCGAHPRSLHRLLRALASLGVFAETEDGRFALTPMAELLRRDVPGSLHGLAIYSGDPKQQRYRAWGDLPESVRTGEPAFRRLVGLPPFAYLAANPDAAAEFDAAMESYTTECVGAILAHYDFSRCSSIVDVGGGHGRVLAEILKEHASLRGVVFDLPHVVERAQALLGREGLAGRAECIGGDFFKAVPVGADLYLLKCIVHDWDDAQALALLRTCRRAMTRDARLLLAEAIIPPGNAPCLGKLMDVNMLVIHGGLERTRDEFAALLHEAGFALTDVILTRSTVDLVEARPI
jgi:O-methyltransferase domain/Dimerisation domain